MEKVRERNCVTYKYDSIEERDKHKEEMQQQGYNELEADWGCKNGVYHYFVEYIEGEVPDIG